MAKIGLREASGVAGINVGVGTKKLDGKDRTEGSKWCRWDKRRGMSQEIKWQR